MKNFYEKYGPWAVVTGAARGIGKAFSFELASKGLNLILIDILDNELLETASELSASFPIKIKTIIADLADPIMLNFVISECKSYKIGLFCCNHAMTKLFSDGKLKTWTDAPLNSLIKMVDVNLMSPVILLHHFANIMKQEKRGGIIIVSSLGAVSGSPYVAQYGATKSFLYHLGQSLWWELKHFGINVLTVLPGLTATDDVLEGLTPYGKDKVKIMTPNLVAFLAINALGKKIVISTGKINTIQYFILKRLLPLKWSISHLGKLLPRCFKADEVCSTDN